MKESERMTAKLLINQLELMTDSQFVAYVAMIGADSDNPLNDYIARRLDRVALILEAQDVASRR